MRLVRNRDHAFRMLHIMPAVVHALPALQSLQLRVCDTRPAALRDTASLLDVLLCTAPSLTSLSCSVPRDDHRLWAYAAARAEGRPVADIAMGVPLCETVTRLSLLSVCDDVDALGQLVRLFPRAVTLEMIIPVSGKPVDALYNVLAGMDTPWRELELNLNGRFSAAAFAALLHAKPSLRSISMPGASALEPQEAASVCECVRRHADRLLYVDPGSAVPREQMEPLLRSLPRLRSSFEPYSDLW